GVLRQLGWALLRWIGTGADGSQHRLARPGDPRGPAAHVGGIHGGVDGHAQVFVGAERNLKGAVVPQFYVRQIIKSGSAKISPTSAVQVVLAFHASMRDIVFRSQL